MKIWILAPAAFSLALCSAEDCPSGTCATPKVSLLQLKSLSQTRETLAAGSGSSSTSAALAGFQKFTDEMISKYGRGDEDKSLAANASELGAVNTILDFLDAMYETFRTAHIDAKQKGDECYSEAYHTHCPFSWTQYKEFEDQWRNSIKDHWSCRREAKEACEHETYWCEEYDHYRIVQTKSKVPQCIVDGAFADSVLGAGSGATSPCSNQLNKNLDGVCKSGYSHNSSPFQGCYKTDTVDTVGSDYYVGKELTFTPTEARAHCKAKGFSDTTSGTEAAQCHSEVVARSRIWTEVLGCGTANSATTFGFEWSKNTLSSKGSYNYFPESYDTSTASADDSEYPTYYFLSGTSGYTDYSVSPPAYVESYTYTLTFKEFVATNPIPSDQAGVGGNKAGIGQNAPGARSGEVSEYTSASGIYQGIDDAVKFVWTYGDTTTDRWHYVDNCKSRVWGRALAQATPIDPDNHAALANWDTKKGSADDAVIYEVLVAIGLWSPSATNVQNCGSLTPTGGEAWADAATISLAQHDESSCPVGGDYCAVELTFQGYPTAEYTCTTGSCCGTIKDQYAVGGVSTAGHADEDLCYYGSAKEDLFASFVAMQGSNSYCDGPTGAWMQTAAYISSGNAVLKLQAFEDCLDVTFDWLYGDSNVQVEQQDYIEKNTVAQSDGSARHYGTGQYHSALGGKGRAAVNALYAAKNNMFAADSNTYFDKLNGKWTSRSDVVPTTVVLPTDASVGTRQYDVLTWERRKWSTATGAWSTNNFDSDMSKWGLWQHYVYCELSESRRKEHLLNRVGTGASTKDYSWMNRLTQDTHGVAYNSTTARHEKWDGVTEDTDDSDGETYVLNKDTWFNSSNYSEHQSFTSDAHCATKYTSATVWEKNCDAADGRTQHMHIRCWDYFTMCTALQHRSERAYQEWKIFREDECDMQERCLTGFGIAVAAGDLALAAIDTEAEQESKDVRNIVQQAHIAGAEGLRRNNDPRLDTCSETCAIEHENALAREADNETAERLKCMLKVLFGSLKTGETWAPCTGDSCGTAKAAESCTDSSNCEAQLECQSNACADITSKWNYTEAAERKTGLANCQSDTTFQMTGGSAYKYKDAWTLHQIECPSWDSGAATRNWWRTKDNTAAAYLALAQATPARLTVGGVDVYEFVGVIPAGPLGPDGTTTTVINAENAPGLLPGSGAYIFGNAGTVALSQVTSVTDASAKCLGREGCGLGLGGCADDEAICHIMCDANRQDGCPGVAWKLEFLTSGYWNTHDVCHLDWSEHTGTLETIQAARSLTAPMGWRTTTTWGVTRSEGEVMDWCTESDTGFGVDPSDSSNTNAAYKRTLRGAIYDDNWQNAVTVAGAGTPTDIFDYMVTAGSYLRTWQDFVFQAGGSTDLYCSTSTRDGSTEETDDTSVTVTLRGFKYSGGQWVQGVKTTAPSTLTCWKQRATQMIVDDEWSGKACPSTYNSFWVNNPPYSEPVPVSAR